MSGFDSATATAPTEEDLKKRSETARHVTPPSVVFHNPPPVAPKKYSSGRLALPAAACDRPPRGGPSERQRNPPNRTGSKTAGSLDAPAAWPCACANRGRRSGP